MSVSMTLSRSDEAVQSPIVFEIALNARIKSLNPNDPDHDTKLLELQSLQSEAQSILAGLEP